VERELAEQIAGQAKDQWTGPLAEDDAARAYLILGEHERALSILERLLAQSYADSITPAFLRLDPLYDLVRDNPRFRKLVGDKP
jgi:serine/threonine-protein kinase